MFLLSTPAIGCLAALILGTVAGSAHAQTNIDQGKTPAQIFAQDCAACHKATRGLANGKNSLSLTLFLREHYTTSREQAAALAAYVLGAGGAEAAKPGQKPGQERAKTEEAKPGEPKTAARPGRPTGKPEPEPPAAAAKPEQQASHPAAAEHEINTPSAPHSRKKEPEASPAPVTQQPAAVVSAPPTSKPPAAEPPKSEPKIETETAPRSEPGQDQTPTTSAAAPMESQPGDGASVPRDNIPD